jgi:UDP-N-acetylmuramate--alanine ligase
MIPRSAHLIGVGGTGMSALAHALLDAGCRVSGSDRTMSEAVSALAQRGAVVHEGHDAAQVPAGVEVVVRSAAVARDNPEALPGTLKYAEMVGRLTRMRRTFAVAGCHGKTTTTALLATILDRAGLKPSFVCGGFIPQLGRPGAWRDGRDLVVEACEYDRSFLHYSVDCAIVTNIEADHLDYFKDLGEIRRAFAEFAARANHVIATPGSVAAAETYGAPEADWQARSLRVVGGCWAFEAWRRGRPFGAFTLRIPGPHNVLNALAAIAAADRAGVGLPILQAAVAEFAGAARRFELLGERGGVAVVDDYAHHPTEIRAVLRAARERFPDRQVWALFQPHQHSRTRLLMDDFARSFGDADRVLVTEVYSARDAETSDAARELTERISRGGPPALFVPSKDDALALARRKIPPGSVLMTLGAGDIGAVAREYVR